MLKILTMLTSFWGKLGSKEVSQTLVVRCLSIIGILYIGISQFISIQQNSKIEQLIEENKQLTNYNAIYLNQIQDLQKNSIELTRHIIKNQQEGNRYLSEQQKFFNEYSTAHYQVRELLKSNTCANSNIPLPVLTILRDRTNQNTTTSHSK